MSGIVDVFVEYGAATSAAIQDAIDDAAVAGDGVKRRLYLSGRTWSITSELTIPSTAKPIELFGDPHNVGVGGTQLVATTSLGSDKALLKILSKSHVLRDLVFDVNRNADYGLRLNDATSVRLEHIAVKNAKRDGIHSDATGLNQGLHLSAGYLAGNGTLYRTAGLAEQYTDRAPWQTALSGTASLTAGQATITVGDDITGLGIRYGDPVRVGTGKVTLTSLTSSSTTATGTTSSAHGWAAGQYVVIAGASPAAYNGTYRIESTPTSTTFTYAFAGGTSPATGTITAINRHAAYYGKIASVSSTQITVMNTVPNLPLFSGSGLDYAVGVGAGWYEERAATNGYNIIDAVSIIRSNGAFGIRMYALYGDTIDTSLVDYNPFAGISIGEPDNANAVFEPVMNHVYMEFNTIDYWPGGAVSGEVNAPSENSDIFMLGVHESLIARGLTTRHGQVESWLLGALQDLLIEVWHDAGTLKHRIVADRWSGHATVSARAVHAPSGTFVATPQVGATTNFSGGAGILAADNAILLFDTPNAQNVAVSGSAGVELNSTGTPYTASLITSAGNVSGLNIRRIGIVLVNSSSGSAVNWNTTTIPSEKRIAIRVRVHMR